MRTLRIINKIIALLIKGSLYSILGAGILLATIWLSAVAILSPALTESIRPLLATLLGFNCLFLFLKKTWRLKLLLSWIIIVFIISLNYLNLEPSNDRAWEKSVARKPSITTKGSFVRISNIRNFQYETEQNFTPKYYTATYDLQKVSSVDILVSYWSSKDIAHIMTSFGFDDGRQLAFSIETRKEEHEQYSPLAGFFRNYELIYVAADERDLIGLRTKIRQPNEQVYLLRLATSRRRARLLLEQFLEKANQLETEPDFYDTLLTNCTTQVFYHSHVNNPFLKLNWKVLLSGHIPEYLHDGGALAKDISFDELMQKSLINEVANKYLDSPNFSQLIRSNVPKPVQKED
jgi:hypothetical protein